MKSKLDLPQDHLSVRLHRKQLWSQILLPILFSAVLLIAIIVLTSIATFRENGEVVRWAAISTIWLVMPIMVVVLMILVILLALIYLLARLIGVIPPYSYQAQKFVYQIEGHIRRGTDMILKPALFVEVIKSQIKKAAERR